MRYLPLAPLLAFAAFPVAADAQTTVTLTATDSKTIATTGQNWNDNRLRAYWSSGIDFADGHVKFDMTSIPDGATITSMTLRVYHEANFNSPQYSPEIKCYRVDSDAWSRGATDPHTGLGVALTGPINTFNSGAQAPNDLVLNVGATSWSGDLLDNTLSLALRNENGNLGIYSYVYFYGSDASPAPPELIVDYTAGPTVAVVAGSPGGSMSFDFSGYTPGGPIAVLYGTAGSLVVPSGPCAGTVLGLSPLNFPPASALVLLSADGNGDASITRNVGAGASGLRVQAADAATCTPSNVITL